jgi:hypothetical protein
MTQKSTSQYISLTPILFLPPKNTWCAFPYPAGPTHWLVSISRANIAAPPLVPCIQLRIPNSPSCAAASPPIDGNARSILHARLLALKQRTSGVVQGVVKRRANCPYNDGPTRANLVRRNHTVVSHFSAHLDQWSPWLVSFQFWAPTLLQYISSS